MRKRVSYLCFKCQEGESIWIWNNKGKGSKWGIGFCRANRRDLGIIRESILLVIYKYQDLKCAWGM